MNILETLQIRPFFWKNSFLYVLDQKQLPFKKTYIKCSTYKEAIECIKNMNVRGAPAIGLVGSYALCLALKNMDSKNFLDLLKKATDEIISARPTAYNLFYCVNRLKQKITLMFSSGKSKKEIFNEALSEAFRLEKENFESLNRLVNYGVKLIKKSSVVLTHCNTGALACGSVGTALGIIIEAYNKGKIQHVFVDETRPYLQGAKLTVFELEEAKVPYTLITDNMAAFVIKEKKVNCVIIGADRIARNGDTANKIGSLNLAILCSYYKIPFYVAAPFSSIDRSIPSGSYIKIEFRTPEEVIYVNEKPITVKKANVLHPAFDVTDAKLITAIITEKGIFRYPYDFSKIC